MRSKNRKQHRGIVAGVTPGSVAAAAGVRAGDVVLSLAGEPLQDVLDYQFRLEPGRNRLGLERGGRRLELLLDLDGDEDPGILFVGALFDGMRSCRNNCRFCFVDQLPPGLRPAVYLKDDDYRLSFLHGNFVTLNHLSDADANRIVAQRLGPMHVSVHASDPEVRAGLMGCSAAAAAGGLERLHRLGAAGIELHTQIVLCPGFNDGPVLDSTISALAGWPGVASIGVVPVAVSGRLEQEEALRPLTLADCQEAIAIIAANQKRFRRQRGVGFVYAADELYLKAGHPLPPLEEYDGLPQYQNGIGIAASFLAEHESLTGALPPLSEGTGLVFLVTGELAAGLMEAAAQRLSARSGLDCRPLAVRNRLFGPHVTVTGLLGGGDIEAGARAAGAGPADLLLVPACALESSGRLFLDGMTAAQLEERLGCRVAVV